MWFQKVILFIQNFKYPSFGFIGKYLNSLILPVIYSGTGN